MIPSFVLRIHGASGLFSTKESYRKKKLGRRCIFVTFILFNKSSSNSIAIDGISTLGRQKESFDDSDGLQFNFKLTKGKILASLSLKGKTMSESNSNMSSFSGINKIKAYLIKMHFKSIYKIV